MMATTLDSCKLLVCGQLLGRRVERGMGLLTADGTRLGTVAALLWSDVARAVVGLLLCQLPQTAVYRQIPLSLVERVEETAVYLTLPAADIAQLPIYEPP